MEETAYAKINLSLHVRGREADGYHRIETIFAFAEDGDRLRVSAADELTLTAEGTFAEDMGGAGDNLVLRAARALRDAYGLSAGAALKLHKRLPVAAGLGGGSADAAAALRLLARWWRLPVDHDGLGAIGRALGADVPACLVSRPRRGEGRGDHLSLVSDDGLAGMPLLLVNPGVRLSTPAVFAAWQGEDEGPLGDGPPLAAALAGRNDLTRPAVSLAPVIEAALNSLTEARGVLLARMSGSGATCFALFESVNARDAARRAIGERFPSWWQLATRLRADDGGG